MYFHLLHYDIIIRLSLFGIGRFNDEWDEDDGAVPKWFNDNILARRKEAYNHLITYARMVSHHLPDSYSRLNLHTLVCRLQKQETARGCTAKDNELWMERAVSEMPCPFSQLCAPMVLTFRAL